VRLSLRHVIRKARRRSSLRSRADVANTPSPPGVPGTYDLAPQDPQLMAEHGDPGAFLVRRRPEPECARARRRTIKNVT
jgi:hypothetical protein